MDAVEDGFCQEFPQGCSAADIIIEMRIDIREMRTDLRHNTETMAEYARCLDTILQDHETRLRSVEAERAEEAGRNRVIGYLKDVAIGLLGAVAGLLGGRAF